MRAVVVLAGDIRDDKGALAWIDQAGWIVCADGGARHLRRLDRLPDLLIGDLDSAQPDDVAWMIQNDVPLDKFPMAKDATDSELAIQAALDHLDHLGQPDHLDQASELPESNASAGSRTSHELVILGAFGSRPDHVLANQLLAANLAALGWRLVLTDGISCLYTLAGGQTLHVERLEAPTPAGRSGKPGRPGVWAFSIVPVTPEINGLTCHSGLVWPLADTTLKLGTTRAVSNRFIEARQNDGRLAYQAIVSLASGIALVIVTPED